MKKDKLKKEFHYFVLTDYEREEEYLRTMHKKGYKFKKVSLPGIYYFEESKPEDVIYKLDFNPQSKEKRQEYLQIYQDYGWEYLQDMNEYSYFRKKACEGEHEKDLEMPEKISNLRLQKNYFYGKIVVSVYAFEEEESE